MQVEHTFPFIDLVPKYIRVIKGVLADTLKSIMSFKHLFIPAYLVA